MDTITSKAEEEVFQKASSIDILRTRLEDYLSIDYNGSFDEIVQQIADEIRKERKEFNEQYHALQKANHDLRLGRSFSILFIIGFSFRYRIREYYGINSSILLE